MFTEQHGELPAFGGDAAQVRRYGVLKSSSSPDNPVLTNLTISICQSSTQNYKDTKPQIIVFTVPEFIDPVLGFKTLIFMKTSTKCSFSFQSMLRDAGIG